MSILLYDAVLLDFSCCVYVFLHSSWDEWISESKILKNTEQNLAKQQELKRLYERYCTIVSLLPGDLSIIIHVFATHHKRKKGIKEKGWRYVCLHLRMYYSEFLFIHHSSFSKAMMD